MTISAAEQALVDAQHVVDNPEGATRTFPLGGDPTHMEKELTGHIWNKTAIRITYPDAAGNPVEYVGIPTHLHYGSPSSIKRHYVDVDVYYVGRLTFAIGDIVKLTANTIDREAALQACESRARAARTSVTLRDEQIRAAVESGVPVERIAQVTELSRARIYQIRDGRR